MPDISKLVLPEDVKPEWCSTGIPACLSDQTCPSFDGKRCAVMGTCAPSPESSHDRHPA